MSDTVVITGVSGFIARHVALACLREGMSVRGALRSLDKVGGGVMGMAEMGAALRQIAPEHAAKAPTAILAPLVVRRAAMADRTLAAVLPDLGARPDPLADYVGLLTGVAARPAKERLGATARSLVKVRAV